MFASESIRYLVLHRFFIFLLSFLLLAEEVTNAAVNIDWCYKDKRCDAQAWDGECQTGKRQSPIDFNDRNTKLHSGVIRLRFNQAYLEVHDKFFIRNNGHSINVQLRESLTSDLKFDGDFLKGSYTFSQLHFHWGSHDDVGSEHTVNGNGYVAEVHLVHYNNEYESLSEALYRNDKRGLAVLGIFLEIKAEDNYAFEPIISAICKVACDPKGKLLEVQSPLNISALLPTSLSLWRYYGSLTTPSCHEVVHWTVFKEPIGISRRQWNALRMAIDYDGISLDDNYRPVQPIFHRKVLFFDHVIERILNEGELRRYPISNGDELLNDAEMTYKGSGVKLSKRRAHFAPTAVGLLLLSFSLQAQQISQL